MMIFLMRIFQIAILVCLLACSSGEGWAQSKQIVKGVVSEEGSGEPLALVAISDSSRRALGTTNRYGYFSFVLDGSTRSVVFSAVGYEPRRVGLMGDTLLSVVLKPLTLQTVEIKGSSQQVLNVNQVTITPSLLSRLPSIGGERDLIKAISLFSGVVPGSELASGFQVRGGGNDQNLFYLDGAPIYSTGHLFNFLSLFNPDAIQKVDFYKGDFPVEFGGRLSSVTDVAFREGNKTRWEGQAELGVISSKITVEGPLVPNKTSVLVAARSAYLNLFNLGKEKAVRNHKADGFFGYNFYDLNVKLNHAFNQNHKVFLSYYRGDDDYRILQNNIMGRSRDQNYRRLTNQLLSARSYHVLGPRLFVQTGLHATRYAFRYTEGNTQFQVETRQPQPWLIPELIYTKTDEALNLSRGVISDVSGNLLAEWLVSKRLRVKAGAELIRHRYQPIDYRLQGTLGDSLVLREPTRTALESAYFGSLTLDLSPRWQWTVGGRYSGFNSSGVRYAGFEPRTSLSFRAGESQLQLSAVRTMQYNHALVQAGELVDKTMWVPSTARIRPQSAWQYAAGWSQVVKGLRYNLGVFYKQMHNLIQYQYTIGVPFVYYDWEANTLTGGRGRAYGAELAASKTLNRWDLGLNYTLSWSQRQFEALNNAQWFPYIYDRRHSFNANALFRISGKTRLSLLWLYYSGQRYHAPVGRIVDNPLGYGYVVYDDLNAGKVPDYHRLDASLTRRFDRPENKYWEVSLNIYNVYSHRNTYRLYPARQTELDSQGNRVGSRYVMRSAAVFPILPSLSIRYKFL